MKQYEDKKIFCLMGECMNNNMGLCGLLDERMDKSCPFFKTKADNDAECMRLGVMTWQEMEAKEKES